MSFQHFRLGEITVHQPLHQQSQPPQVTTTTKQPYGSGDTDDGYTLLFENISAFQAWRQQEEETQCVEFVKGDTHGSKADPPRFKDHTKLVCARHSRSGRKKYVKKHPERVRKVPSRKLEGQGCQASISYKTYFDTEQVRACYISQHSHPVGLANLPYTRRGRKAAVQQEKERTRNKASSVDPTSAPSTSGSTSVIAPQPAAQQPQSSFGAAVSMIAPLPGQQPFQPPPQQQYPFAPAAPSASLTNMVAQDRWDNMGTLFQAIRDHARGFEYPSPSVAALEAVLIRLYLESPMTVPPANPLLQAQPPNIPHPMAQVRPTVVQMQSSSSSSGHLSASGTADGSNSEDTS
ncbi:hypothetical protein CVT24_009046 [Panaeolus cyanescens]|uniref:Uncharacterized protein n=1 Tax=Panaeolus cyanescens TaxID=181874 RepID=A0A409YAK5_9AGAR|nr:hypothetical protein CVT24_009046 [Panaeolus cyanescens]